MTAKQYPHPESTKARIMATLTKHKTGMGPRKLAAALDIGITTASDAVVELGKAGLLVSVRDGSGKAHQGKRWCLPKHAEAAKAAVQKEAEEAPLHWKRAGMGRVVAPGNAHVGPPKVTRAKPLPSRWGSSPAQSVVSSAEARPWAHACAEAMGAV